MPALSPNGKQLAVQVSDPARFTSELWLWDLTRNLGSRFTFADRVVLHAAWSSDGTRLVYGREHGIGFGIFVNSVGAFGAESLLYASSRVLNVCDWSTDGHWVLYMTGSKSNNDIDMYALSTSDPLHPAPVVATQFWEVHPALSPDGNWLAYASTESGQFEVYVQPFMRPGGRWRISTQGGLQPFWRGDGREMFYLALDGGLMSVPVEPGAPPRFSHPVKLFEAPAKVRFDTPNQYAPTRDGQRFLFVASGGEAKPGTTTIMLDWPALLPKR
jgi:Tol biopolymer transport system component